jgi:hypothetical protein
MHILSFDLAAKSLGVCFAHHDTGYLQKIETLMLKFDEQNKNMERDTSIEGIKKRIKLISDVVVDLDLICQGAVNILYLDVIDLAPGMHVQKERPPSKKKREQYNKTHDDKKSYLLASPPAIMSALHRYLLDLDNIVKYFMSSLQVKSQPDKVLLEYQMSPGSPGNKVYHSIMCWYSLGDASYLSHNSIPDLKMGGASVSENREIAFKKNMIDFNHVIKVSPRLKNSLAYDFDCDYKLFTEKYKKQYTANKKHSEANLMKWLEIFNQKHFIKNIANANLDDAADAFNMIIAWLKFKHYGNDPAVLPLPKTMPVSGNVDNFIIKIKTKKNKLSVVTSAPMQLINTLTHAQYQPHYENV